MSDAIVIGASGGIGHAITTQLLASGRFETVIGTFRQAGSWSESLMSQGARLARLDVCDDRSIARFTEEYAKEIARSSMLVYCPGLLHDDRTRPEKSIRQVERKGLQRVFDLNSFSPVLVARALLPVLSRREPVRFGFLSAMVGSIGDNRLGGWYAYRASKAALNQLVRTLAIECRRTHPHLFLATLHPGTTNTALSRPFQANVPTQRLYSPDLSARRIIEVLSSGQPEQSGAFLNWTGEAIPW